MDLRMPPLKIKIMLESNPLKSRILVMREIGRRSAPVKRARRRFPASACRGPFLPRACRGGPAAAEGAAACPTFLFYVYVLLYVLFNVVVLFVTCVLQRHVRPRC